MRLAVLASATLLGLTLIAGCGDDDPQHSEPTPDASTSAGTSGTEGGTPTEPTEPTDSAPAGVLVERPGFALQVPEQWQVEPGDDSVRAQLATDPVAILSISRHELTPMPPLADLVEMGENLMSASTGVKRVADTTVAGAAAFVFEGEDLGYPRIVVGMERSDGIVTLALTHPGSMADARAALDGMLASWQWR
ncbi:hypothetical protein NODU109028_01125 [Nocardioides dubius]|uniref:DUF1795 domain-containing protein n=1 Tax=Nocardioides dubius TaxID=317019 RepID=A0ABP4EF70_9ACTN